MLLFAIVLTSCNTASTEKKETEDDLRITLIKKWESEPVFTTAESALYDKASNVIYVSNIEGEPWVNDAIGSIGKLSVDGSVLDSRWVEGLNAPKGMGIYEKILYVADNQRLIEIDITIGKVVNAYEVEGCEGLNDVSIAKDGTVYFTDSQKGAIYMLKNGEISTVLDSLQGSNGILVEDHRILFATWGNESLNEYLFEDKSRKIIADSLAQPDGIVSLGDGAYLVSSWKGLLHYIEADGRTHLILDTSDDIINAADIGYIADKNLILVPTFFKNSVVAYELQVNQ